MGIATRAARAALAAGLAAAMAGAPACGGGGGGGRDAAADVTEDAAPDSAGGDVAPDALDTADAGDGPADVPPDDGGGADVGPCDWPAPLAPFELAVNGLPDFGDAELSGPAYVLSYGPYPGGAAWDWQLRLLLLDAAQILDLRGTAPLQQGPPVREGERLYVHAERQQPWWSNLYVALWGPSTPGGADADAVRFLWYEGNAFGSGLFDCAGKTPCPTLALLATGCPAVDGSCGTLVRPPVAVDLGAVPLEVPHAASVTAARTRATAAQTRQQVQMDCVDYPASWLAVVATDQGAVSRCPCEGPADCAPGFVCETEVHRCVPDLCPPEPADPCDPYTGETVLPDLPPCQTTADCAAGQVCNTLVGGCQVDVCAQLGSPLPCAPLLGETYLCLDACDCGEGSCDPATRTCVTCDDAKLAPIPRDGTFENYEVCVPGDAVPAYEVALKAIDPDMTCGTAGVFAGCKDAGLVGCFGGELTYEGGQIAGDLWQQLCAISRLPFVKKMGGGYWL